MDYLADVDWNAVGEHVWALIQAAAADPSSVVKALPGLAIMGLGLLALVMMRPKSPALYGAAQPQPLPPVSTRGYRPRGPVYIPFDLGNVTIDLQPTARDTIHTVIGGTSGLGKSTSVLPLLDLDIGVLVVALDNTRPIAEYVRSLPDGVEWTNEEGSPGWGLGLDLLSGKPAVAAEVLVAGWAAKTGADTGKWRDIASDRLRKAIAHLDTLGVTRNFGDLVLALLQRTGDAEGDRACQDWARRLAILSDTLGPALGNDLELVRAMRDRRKVLLRLNRFMHPRLAPMLGGMLLVHARRVMQEAGVPFVLIIEEAGQLDMYEEHMSPIFQAGRDRGDPVVLLSQNMRRLKLEVQNNVSVWVSFAQEAKLELDFAAERLRLEPEQLLRETFKDQGRGWCYVRAPGVITTLVRVKQRKPRRGPSALSPQVAGPSVGPYARTVDTTWTVVEPTAVDGWMPYPPMLADRAETGHFEEAPDWIGTDRDMVRMWAQTRRTGVPCPLWSPERGVWWDERGCLEWTGGVNTDGRGRSSIRRRDVLVYREFFYRAKGYYPDPTMDHLCDRTICVDPEHGEAVTIGENNARRAGRKAAFKVAWAADQGRRVTA